MIESIRNAIIIIVIGAALSISLLGVGQTNQPDLKSQFASQYEIVKAHTQNALIEIYVDSPQELMQQAQQINTTTIYETNSGFVVIDHVTDTAYICYKQSLWFELPGVPYAALSLVPLLITVIVICFWDSSKRSD